MAVNLDAFSGLQNVSGRVVQSGDNQTGEVVQSQKTIFGKIATWFKSTFRPGTFADENKKVMQSFINAITDKRGSGMGRLATRLLQSDLDAGRSLTSAKIKSTMTRIDQAIIQRNHTMNTPTINRFSSYNADDTFNTLGKIMSETASEMEMSDRISDMDTDRITTRIRARLEAAGNNGKNLISQTRAKAIARGVVKEELTALKNIDTVKQWATEAEIPLTSPKLTALSTLFFEQHIDSGQELQLLFNMVKDLPVKADTDLSAMYKLVRTMNSAFGTFRGEGMPSHNILGQLNRLSGALIQTVESLHDVVGSDEVISTITTSIGRFLEQSGFDQSSLEKCYANLTSKDTKDYMAGLGILMSGKYAKNEAGIQSTSKAFRSLRVIQNLTMEVGLKLDKSRSQIAEDMEFPDINHPRQISINTHLAMKQAGINLPYPGSRTKGECPTPFVRELEALLPTMLAGSDGFSKDNICTAMVKDMGRCTYKLDGKDITRPGGKGKYSVAKATVKLNKALKTPDVLKTISSLAHQGMFGIFIQQMLLRSDGPCNAMLAEVHNDNHLLEYNIRTDDPDKVFVDFNYKTNLTHLSNDTGTHKMNPDSRLGLSFTVAINRDSIESGMPVMQFSGPVKYDAHFIPK